MRRITLLILTFLLTPFAAVARVDSHPESVTELVVMNLAAHPDDEDGRTLAYYRWAKDARTFSVIYTRGEGGQNEIGPELYEELGAIRTRETERAARILGTQVYFLNFPDFGYSRTADETFDWWGGRDAVTARITYLIRKLRPDVLFTNHDTTSGHGHHQAVGRSAFDAFALAADPEYHPEQLEEAGVELWQPQRLFVRHWNQPESFSVAVPVGDEYEPGVSYADLAARALREHESQGMAMFAGRFAAPATYFSLLRQAEEIPLDPHDLAGNLPLREKPQPSLRYLIDSRRLPALNPEAITLSDSVVVPGARTHLVVDSASLPAFPLRFRLEGAVDTTFLLVEGLHRDPELRIPRDAGPTHPLVVFQYDRFLNSPPVAYAVEEVSTGRRLAGGYLPLEIAPAFLLDPATSVLRMQRNGVQVPFRTTVWDERIEQITVRAVVSSADTRQVLGQNYTTLSRREFAPLDGVVDVKLSGDVRPGTYQIALTAVADPASAELEPDHRFVTGRAFDVRVPHHLRVGIIESYDNSLATALSELNVDHVLLDSISLASGDFADLHTILVDIRAYLVRDDLRRHNDRLLDWVREGGHLVVNYQKTFEWNEGEADPFLPGHINEVSFAPYPIRLGRGRVTREDAPVTLLQPDHPLLHAPNRIEDVDWAGWVQERGLYFPQEYDERYLELFSLHDPGESPLRGSTLITRYGEGTYLYTALAWYRQLKELHPGSFKFFANMVSLPLVADPYGGAAASGID